MNERCPKCGWPNPKNAEKCASCGDTLTPPQQEGPFDPEQLKAPGEQTPFTSDYPESTPYGSGLDSSVDVPNYLAWGVVMTILSALCCSVLAVVPSIVGLVFASQANSRRLIGDYAGGVETARKARTWLMVATVLLLIGIAVGILWAIISGMKGFSDGWSSPQHI